MGNFNNKMKATSIFVILALLGITDASSNVKSLLQGAPEDDTLVETSS